MLIIICLLIIYYKENFYKFYKKYIDGNFFYFTQLGDDFFYRKSIYNITTVIPILFISLILSLVSTYILKDIYMAIDFEKYTILEFGIWLITSLIFFVYTYIRLYIFLIIGKLFRFTKNIINVFVFDFLRVTIFLLIINIFIFFIFYSTIDFQFAKYVFEINRYLIVIYRFIYFFLRVKKIQHINNFKLIIYLIITDLSISLITLIFDYDDLKNFIIKS